MTDHLIGGECDCCGPVVEWYHMEQCHPGISYSSDGRVRVAQDGEVLVLPSPAAEILKDAWARKVVGGL